MRFSVSLLFFFLLSAGYQLTAQHSFSYNSPVCQNATNPAPVTSTNFTTGGTYSAGTGLNINSSTGVITLASSAVGIYTVTYTVASAANTSATIQILPVPPPITVTGNTICASATTSQFTLQANSSDATMSYVWMPSGMPGSTFNAPYGINTYTVVGTVNTCTTQAVVTTSLIAGTSPNVTGPTQVCAGQSVTLTASGVVSYTWSTGALTAVMTDTPPPVVGFYTYTVYGTDALGCEGQHTHTVAVLPTPTVSIVANSTVCAGYNFQMVASGASTYSWSTGAIGPNVTVKPTASLTTYTVVGTSNSCTHAAMHTVSWVSLPVIIIVGPATVCAGSSVTLKATSPDGSPTYTWNNGSTADTLHVSPFVITTYTAWGTLNGCVGSDVHQVTVYPRPNLVVLPATSTVCTMTGIIKTAINAVTYTWSTGAKTNTVFLNPQRDTSYTVSGTNSVGCVDTKTVNLFVTPTPTISVGSTSICSGETATVEAVATPPEGVTYQWLPTGQVSATLNVSPQVTSTYTVTAKIGGCSSNAVSTVSVTKTINATVSFKYDGPYCNGNYSATPILTPSFTPGGSFFSNGELPVDPVTGVVNLNTVNEGFYSVNYSVATRGCTLENTGFATFLVNKSIYLTPTVDYVEILPGQEVKLDHSGGAFKYQWYPPVDLSCTNCEYPLATPLESTQYCVESAQPCVFGSCIMVEVLCLNYGDLSVPNAFSPNNDGKNDKFCLQGWKECNIDFYIAIFDRWGTKVYESENPNFCWDGVFNGTPLPSAVYMYQINAQFKKEPAIKKSGNISLLR